MFVLKTGLSGCSDRTKRRKHAHERRTNPREDEIRTIENRNPNLDETQTLIIITPYVTTILPTHRNLINQSNVENALLDILTVLNTVLQARGSQSNEERLDRDMEAF